VGGTPGGSLETSGIEDAMVVRVDGHVIDSPADVQDVAPTQPAIGGEENAALFREASLVAVEPSPGGKVQAQRIVRVHGDGYWTVQTLRQRHLLPAFSAIRGSV